MERKTKIPITRLNMWYDSNDFDLDMDFAKEFLENDANFKVILFQVDRVNTQMDDVYGESDPDDVRFLPPVEIIVSGLKIDPAEVKNYGNSNATLSYMDRGNLSFSVVTSTLTEKNVDIKRGDFIGYSTSEDSLQYYSVINDGRVNTDNQHTRFGYKPYYRSIVCVTVDKNQFKGL